MDFSFSPTMHTLLTITGPTACGKTSLAVEVAYQLKGEIISADSRQVFRGMDIGTGKDLEEYHTHGVEIPYHLIDIHDAGYEYNVYQFQNDFIRAYNTIVERGHQPILCGGTGLYVESVVKGYQLPDAPIDEAFRQSLEPYSDEELTARLASYIKLHNHTDTETRDRLLRALEIQEYARQHPEEHVRMPEMRHLIIGVAYPREVVVERIGVRLRQRLEEGMVEEVQRLLQQGVPPERLLRYGLEYKHLTRYLQGQCSYDDMTRDLYTDIRRFSKRQMTWFRRMERNGITIHWIDGQKTTEEKAKEVISLLKSLPGEEKC
ncbi:MAG: tRNA (adenosine(37)-N6)-dimethylallyltransferase MiaA [Bacteroidales bacterium]|nr:tRNA (adenosine(37)-N6)-dimethylallyltransferase MiaA [Bacteroidales bacterium]